MSDWLAWQLADSAFPTGAFAHSSGLEAAWQQGEVATSGEMRQFVRATILQTGYGALPLVNAAFHAPERLSQFDALNDAFLTNPVANRASRVQGRTLIATCLRIWPSPALASLEDATHSLCTHVAPMMGAAMRAMTVTLEVAQRVVVFTGARGVLSAAVRLGVLGSYEAQRMQYECAGDFDAVLAKCGRLTEGDLTQTAPVIDMLQSRHGQLYSRLFQS